MGPGQDHHHVGQDHHDVDQDHHDVGQDHHDGDDDGYHEVSWILYFKSGIYDKLRRMLEIQLGMNNKLHLML